MAVDKLVFVKNEVYFLTNNVLSNFVRLQPLLVNGYGEDCKIDITLLACQHFCTLDVENVVLFQAKDRLKCLFLMNIMQRFQRMLESFSAEGKKK